MDGLERDLAAAGGLVRRAQLLSRGHSAASIRAAVQDKRLSVPRRGWLAADSADPMGLRAVMLGGQLGGDAALASWGIWVDSARGLTVTCSPNSSRLPEIAGSERRLWAVPRFPEVSPKAWRVSVRDALLQYATFASRDELIASLDSALNSRVLRRSELTELIAALPRRLRSVASEIDGTAMSGNETRFRLAARRAGFRVATQVTIPGVGIVDNLIDDWLIVEIDSKLYHGGEDNQFRDRTRDGNAVLRRYGHERFSPAQVQRQIDWCLAVVEARLAEGPPIREQEAGGIRR